MDTSNFVENVSSMIWNQVVNLKRKEKVSHIYLWMLVQNYRQPTLKLRTFSFHLHAESLLSTYKRFVRSWLFPVDTLSICFPSGWLHAAKGLHWSPHSEIFLASRKLTKRYIGHQNSVGWQIWSSQLAIWKMPQAAEESGTQSPPQCSARGAGSHHLLRLVAKCSSAVVDRGSAPAAKSAGHNSICSVRRHMVKVLGATLGAQTLGPDCSLQLAFLGLEQELIPTTSDPSMGWGGGLANWPKSSMGCWCVHSCCKQLSVNTWSPYQRSVYETQLLEWQKILCC